VLLGQYTRLLTAQRHSGPIFSGGIVRRARSLIVCRPSRCATRFRGATSRSALGALWLLDGALTRKTRTSALATGLVLSIAIWVG
jgi:hypothetical protein